MNRFDLEYPIKLLLNIGKWVSSYVIESQWASFNLTTMLTAFL